MMSERPTVIKHIELLVKQYVFNTERCVAILLHAVLGCRYANSKLVQTDVTVPSVGLFDITNTHKNYTAQQ
jgi:hypothetical protein